jgi:hypothetical protein
MGGGYLTRAIEERQMILKWVLRLQYMARFSCFSAGCSQSLEWTLEFHKRRGNFLISLASRGLSSAELV